MLIVSGPENRAGVWTFYERNPFDLAPYCGVGLWPAFAMWHHKRDLPHYYPPEAILFRTWRLFGSLGSLRTRLCQMRAKPLRGPTVCWTQARNGPLWLKCPRIAALVANALQQGEREYRLYERYAWVIMPNHVHVVMQPFRPLPGNEMGQGIHRAPSQHAAGTNRESILAIRDL